MEYILATVVTTVESVPWKRARSESSRTHSALSTEATPAEVPAEANILHLTALGINDRYRQAGRRAGERSEGGRRERDAADREVWMDKWLDELSVT